MTDIIDQANDIAQQTIERAIANAPKFDRPSSLECEDCGDLSHPSADSLAVLPAVPTAKPT